MKRMLEEDHANPSKTFGWRVWTLTTSLCLTDSAATIEVAMAVLLMSWSDQNVLTHCSYWSDDSNVAGASDVGIDDAIDDLIDVVALLILFAAAIDVAF